MSWFNALLIYGITILSAIAAGLGCYLMLLNARLKKLVRKVPTAATAAKPFNSESPLIMRYSEYKHRYGSRARDIAILASSKQQASIDIVNEFSNTMREHGSLLYHFTHYWGLNNLKTVQKQMNEVVNGNYHGLLSVGLTATRLAKHTTSTHNKLLPTVFVGVRDVWWEQEQKKQLCPNITGVTGSSGWPIRIRFYVNVKPDMRTALIPVTQTCIPTDVKEVASLLQHYGVVPHMVKVHDAHDFLNTITHYGDKVDTLITLQDGITPHIAGKIAALCAHQNIAFFSAFLDDTNNGAAVTVSCPQPRVGWHAAHKMISILENHKPPHEIPITNIGTDISYEAHFNQQAMRAQGMDPSILTSLALQYGSKIHIAVPVRKE